MIDSHIVTFFKCLQDLGERCIGKYQFTRDPAICIGWGDFSNVDGGCFFMQFPQNFLSRKRRFPSKGTTVSQAGNYSSLGRKLEFPNEGITRKL